eukprot:g5128.t1
MEKEGYDSVKHLSDQELERQKQAALDACSVEHHKYLKCVEAGGLNLLSSGFCYEDNKNFWKCYKEKRGFLAWKFRRVIDNSNKLSINYEKQMKQINNKMEEDDGT